MADINIDMIGRNWADTIVAIGKEHSDLGATLERVNAAHPELRMTAIDDRWPEERFYFRSDHYNFARKGVPDPLLLQRRPRGLPPRSPTRRRRSTARRSRGSSSCCTTSARRSATRRERPKWKPESRADDRRRSDGAMTDVASRISTPSAPG